MFFVFLIGGTILVRFLAFLVGPDRNVPKFIRILITIGLGVVIGLLTPSMLESVPQFTENQGPIMTILNGLGLVPLFMGIGSSLVLVSVAAEGDSETWVEFFRDDKYSYGQDTCGLPLWCMIMFAMLFSGFIYLLIYGISLPIALGLYYIVQFIGLIMAIKGDR
jgi:hypothetical protein